jgi:hypothetical protein
VNTRQKDAIVLMALGALIAGLCGSCTLLFWGGSIPKNGVLANPVTTIGGVPAALGFMLFVAGAVLWLRARRRGDDA